MEERAGSVKADIRRAQTPRVDQPVKNFSFNGSVQMDRVVSRSFNS
jgi:hypothetical protein